MVECKIKDAKRRRRGEGRAVASLCVFLDDALLDPVVLAMCGKIDNAQDLLDGSPAGKRLDELHKELDDHLRPRLFGKQSFQDLRTCNVRQ